MQPINLEAERYDEDPLVDSIMNPSNRDLIPGDVVRVLTEDGKQNRYTILSRSEAQLSLKRTGLFRAKVDIPVDEIVFIERDIRAGGFDEFSDYPALDETDPADQGLSCPELEHAILHADVLRRAVNRQIYMLLPYYKLGASIELRGKDVKSLTQIGERSIIARDAASVRLIHLLRLWESRGCSSTTIGPDKITIGVTLLQFEKLSQEKALPQADIRKIDKAIQRMLDKIRE